MIAVVIFCLVCAAACVMTLVWLERDGQLAAQFVICKAALYLLIPAFINAVVLPDTYTVTVGQLLAVALFFAGAGVAAVLMDRRNATRFRVRAVSPSAFTAREVPPAHVMILLLGVLVLWLVNVYAWIAYDLFFRRIGTENIAQLYASLPSGIRVGLRLWDIFMGPSLILLMTYYWHALRTLGKTMVSVLCAGYVIYGTITSRLAVLDFFLLLLIVRQAHFRTFFKFIPLLLVPAIVTFALRADLASQTIRGQIWSQWAERVDCFSLLGEIDNRMWSASDPLMGKTWMDATFGRVRIMFDPTFREAYLASAETGSKNAIAAAFGLDKGPDYVSCIVSDVYGNLWLPGTFLIGFALVLLAATFERRLRAARNIYDRLFLVAALAMVLIFERDLNEVVFFIVLIWVSALAFCWAGWPWQRSSRLV